MSVTHPTLIRNGIANHVVDQLDVGGPGKLKILTATGSGSNGVVSTLTFNATAFGAAATGQAVANPITSDTNAVGGTAAKAEFRTAASSVIVACSVTSTSGGGDIKLGSTTIVAAQTVSISSLRYVATA